MTRIGQQQRPRAKVATVAQQWGAWRRAACRALVGSPDLSDVQLALDDGTQVPAHRLFLMLGSPALRRRLERLRPGEALAMPGCSRYGLLCTPTWITWRWVYAPRLELQLRFVFWSFLKGWT